MKYQKVLFSESRDSYKTTAAAILEPMKQPMSCRGKIQYCVAESIAIKERQSISDTPVRVRILRQDENARIVPESLDIKSTGTNQFEVILSEAVLTEIRTVLRESAPVENASVDEESKEIDDGDILRRR